MTLSFSENLAEDTPRAHAARTIDDGYEILPSVRNSAFFHLPSSFLSQKYHGAHECSLRSGSLSAYANVCVPAVLENYLQRQMLPKIRRCIGILLISHCSSTSTRSSKSAAKSACVLIAQNPQESNERAAFRLASLKSTKPGGTPSNVCSSVSRDSRGATDAQVCFVDARESL